MPSCRHSAWWSSALLLTLASALSAFPPDDRAPAAPRAYHAKTYPAHEAHEKEKLTIAADPYDMADKAAVFVTPYRKEGILPVHLILSNDGKQPVSLQDLRVELITVKRVKIAPASPDDLYRKLARHTRRGDEPSRNPLPIPLPRKKPDFSIKREYAEEIDRLRFLARAVEPESTQGGFLFFDVEGIPNPLAGGYLYVSGIRNADGQELFYFEIPLEKYLSYTPGVK
ncbi:MAG: hypothetical protein L0212_07640 [Acidobacteria bacterium]|nr:hypothetical protein [Acidobacteriota bacterium]